jgi:hypothetical protein
MWIRLWVKSDVYYEVIVIILELYYNNLSKGLNNLRKIRGKTALLDSLIFQKISVIFVIYCKVIWLAAADIALTCLGMMG